MARPVVAIRERIKEGRAHGPCQVRVLTHVFTQPRGDMDPVALLDRVFQDAGFEPSEVTFAGMLYTTAQKGWTQEEIDFLLANDYMRRDQPGCIVVVRDPASWGEYGY